MVQASIVSEDLLWFRSSVESEDLQRSGPVWLVETGGGQLF